MKKFYLISLLLLSIIVCGCNVKDAQRDTKESDSKNISKDSPKDADKKREIDCEELENETFHLVINQSKIDYEARKKQINAFYDKCTRKNLDRWYSLGYEALSVSDQAVDENLKMHYLKIAYDNFKLTSVDDGFLAASEALAIGRKYYELKDWEHALVWMNKAIPYYQKSRRTMIKSLPMYIGDVYLEKNDYLNAQKMYKEALRNFEDDKDVRGRRTYSEISEKLQKVTSLKNSETEVKSKE